MNVFCLGPEQVDNLWPEYGHHLERYERDTGIDYAGTIRQDLRLAHKQLWGIQNDAGKVLGVIITKIVDTPGGEVCEIHATCGTSAGLKHAVELALPHIERWARDVGCVRVRVVGRKGWLRVLTDYAYRGVVMEKEL